MEQVDVAAMWQPGEVNCNDRILEEWVDTEARESYLQQRRQGLNDMKNSHLLDDVAGVMVAGVVAYVVAVAEDCTKLAKANGEVIAVVALELEAAALALQFQLHHASLKSRPPHEHNLSKDCRCLDFS